MHKIKEMKPIPLTKGVSEDELNRLLTTPHTPRFLHFHSWVYWKFWQKRHRVCRTCYKKQMERSGILKQPGDGWVPDTVFTN